MRHIVEHRTCDKCGTSNNTPTIPYLAWVYLEFVPHGIPMPQVEKIDLCHFCKVDVIKFIKGE